MSLRFTGWNFNLDVRDKMGCEQVLSNRAPKTICETAILFVFTLQASPEMKN